MLSETENFADLMRVTAYLQASGFRCSKSSVYRHAASGKLRAGKDGRFSLEQVHKYARRYLRKAADQPRRLPKEHDDDLQSRKLRAEIDRLEGQARITRVRERVMSGAYMPRADAERDLARRAAFLKNDISFFIYAEAPRLVAFVDGDPEKVPEVIGLWIDAVDEWLARYAEDRPWGATVPFADPPALPDDPDEIEDEDIEGNEITV